MATEEKKNIDTDSEQEPNLKGTLISVSLVGVFLLIAWFAAFFVFIAR